MTPGLRWSKEDTKEVARRRLLKIRQLETQLSRRRDEGQTEGRRLALMAADGDSSVVRVWGFGSAFETTRPFRLDSDLDLGVEGGGTRAWAISQKSTWKVDWVELDDQEVDFVEQVKNRGYCSMNDPDSLRRLQSELENDYRFIERCGKELNTFSQRWRQSPEDEMAAIAVAYGLHNLYGAFEGYFLRISKHFENHLPPSNWRSELVEKMTLSIPEIRPSLFDEGYLLEIDELRRFRHVFRNLYKSHLNPEKVRLVEKICKDTVVRFQPLHQHFQAWLGELIASEVYTIDSRGQ